MRIVFFGTPDFAASSLEAIAQSEIDIAAVVTAKDHPDKRHHSRMIYSAVKLKAEQLGLPVLQPKSLKNKIFLSQLSALNADLFVVVAFRMLPVQVWDMPRKGSVNLHGSLLPAYRGAAPINWAIINGEKVTGLTVFQLATDIDTGRILKQTTINISPEETFGILYDRMKKAGAELLVETLKELALNKVHFQAQDETLVSYAPKLTPENTRINFLFSASQIVDFVRGLNPVPTAWMELEGKKIKIFQCGIVQKGIEPGEIIIDKTGFYFGASDGCVSILELQPEGKKRMTVKDWINGRKTV